MAMGDPQLPQGFTPVKSKVIWPGERLTVGCEFDSSNQTHVVVAGSDHNHEMCNMYLMVYGSVAHIEMCSDGMSLVDELSPGNMPHNAVLTRDPFPLWKPPKPAAKLNDKVCRCLFWGGGGGVSIGGYAGVDGVQRPFCSRPACVCTVLPTAATCAHTYICTVVAQGVVGTMASVAMGPDGTVWVLTRGGRVWTPASFNADNTITDTEPIAADVVMQLHPDTGERSERVVGGMVSGGVGWLVMGGQAGE